MTTLLTLGLDEGSQGRFEALRRANFPAAINRVPAHVSLFHQLPDGSHTEGAIRAVASQVAPFAVQVIGLRSLGHGCSFELFGPELNEIHGELSRIFVDALIPQDRQKFQPHVVVQNKVDGVTAKATMARLQAEFTPWTARAESLLWWEYMGGPWKLIERVEFSG